MLVEGFKLITSLSKEEKNHFYREALDLYNQGYSAYMCMCLYRAFCSTHHAHEIKEVMVLFPELTAFKTGMYTEPWFDVNDRIKRIEILKGFIRITT